MTSTLRHKDHEGHKDHKEQFATTTFATFHSSLVRSAVSHTEAVAGFIAFDVYQAAVPSTDLRRTFKSADDSYTVRLTGTFRQLYNPFVLARVGVVVAKDGVVIADLGDVFDADSFDTSFDALYPRHAWTGSGAFRMTGAAENDALDEISVKNDSGKAINGMSVATTDTVVFMNVLPGSTTGSPVLSMSSGGGVYVRVKVQFGDGQRLEESLNLEPAAKEQQRNRLAITVLKDRFVMGLNAKDRSPQPQ